MFPSVNGNSAFQTNLYCMERKKQVWRKAGEGSWEWGFQKGRYCPIRWFMQRGRHSLLKQIHLYGSHAVSLRESCGYAAGTLLYVTSRKYMVLRSGIFTVERWWGVKWKAAWHSFPAMQVDFQQWYSDEKSYRDERKKGCQCPGFIFSFHSVNSFKRDRRSHAAGSAVVI